MTIMLVHITTMFYCLTFAAVQRKSSSSLSTLRFGKALIRSCHQNDRHTKTMTATDQYLVDGGADFVTTGFSLFQFVLFVCFYRLPSTPVFG